eukprot:6174445-Pleurochrysis_carterae.AAC.3
MSRSPWFQACIPCSGCCGMSEDTLDVRRITDLSYKAHPCAAHPRLTRSPAHGMHARMRSQCVHAPMLATRTNVARTRRRACYARIACMLQSCWHHTSAGTLAAHVHYPLVTRLLPPRPDLDTREVLASGRAGEGPLSSLSSRLVTEMGHMMHGCELTVATDAAHDSFSPCGVIPFPPHAPLRPPGRFFVAVCSRSCFCCCRGTVEIFSGDSTDDHLEITTYAELSSARSMRARVRAHAYARCIRMLTCSHARARACMRISSRAQAQARVT